MLLIFGTLVFLAGMAVGWKITELYYDARVERLIDYIITHRLTAHKNRAML